MAAVAALLPFALFNHAWMATESLLIGGRQRAPSWLHRWPRPRLSAWKADCPRKPEPVGTTKALAWGWEWESFSWLPADQLCRPADTFIRQLHPCLHALLLVKGFTPGTDSRYSAYPFCCTRCSHAIPFLAITSLNTELPILSNALYLLHQPDLDCLDTFSLGNLQGEWARKVTFLGAPAGASRSSSSSKSSSSSSSSSESDSSPVSFSLLWMDSPGVARPSSSLSLLLRPLHNTPAQLHQAPENGHAPWRCGGHRVIEGASPSYCALFIF